jgi:hypothetical protein
MVEKQKTGRKSTEPQTCKEKQKIEEPRKPYQKNRIGGPRPMLPRPWARYIPAHMRALNRNRQFTLACSAVLLGNPYLILVAPITSAMHTPSHRYPMKRACPAMRLVYLVRFFYFLLGRFSCFSVSCGFWAVYFGFFSS